MVEMIQFLMVIRAILSWIPSLYGSPISSLLYQLTEPLIAPVRSLMDRYGIGRGFPVDLSFLITFLLLSMVPRILYSLFYLF